MTFCPICGAHHDPNVPCLDRAGELLRDAGTKREWSHMSEQELGETVKKANRVVAVILAILAALLGMAILLSQPTSR